MNDDRNAIFFSSVCVKAQWWLGGSLCDSVLRPMVGCCVRECLCVKPRDGCIGSVIVVIRE